MNDSSNQNIVLLLRCIKKILAKELINIKKRYEIMNKIFKGLAVASLITLPVLADHTNKTFLMPRPTGVDLPMEYNTWEELVNRKTNKDKFGGHLQVVGFYYGSSNDGETGKYFGVHNKSSFVATTETAGTGASNVKTDVDLKYFLHDWNDELYGKTDHASSANISLDPEHDAYGALFNYYQNLDCLLKGLFLKANLPVVCVENDARLRISNPTLGTATAGTVPAATLKSNLEKFFSGDFETTAGENQQVKLNHALYRGRQSETGVADIDLALGYKFLNKENYYASLALAITIPTGNDADGVYMFEPIVGNGQHFGLGGNLEGMVRVWGDCDQNIKLHLKVNYRYLFESHEHRTLGIKKDDGTVRDWGHYYLLSPTTGAAPKTGALVPAANKTTLNTDVTPGSQLDGILGFAYNNGGFTFDLGYNLYVREAEDVHLKDTFEKDAWGLAARTPKTATANVIETGTTAPLTNNSLVLAVAETPSQATHAIYGGFGYIFKEWEYPLQLRLGGKYEWPGENSAIEKWTIHGGIGIGF